MGVGIYRVRVQIRQGWSQLVDAFRLMIIIVVPHYPGSDEIRTCHEPSPGLDSRDAELNTMWLLVE